jgi:hypothetical protein
MWHLCDVFKFCGFIEIDQNIFTASILMFILFSHLILIAFV